MYVCERHINRKGRLRFQAVYTWNDILIWDSSRVIAQIFTEIDRFFNASKLRQIQTLYTKNGLFPVGYDSSKVIAQVFKANERFLSASQLIQISMF